MSTVSLVKAQLCCPLNPLRISYYYREVRYATIFDELLLSLPLRHSELGSAPLSAVCEVFKIEPVFIRSSLSALLSAGLLTIGDEGRAAIDGIPAGGDAASGDAAAGDSAAGSAGAGAAGTAQAAATEADGAAGGGAAEGSAGAGEAGRAAAGGRGSAAPAASFNAAALDLNAITVGSLKITAMGQEFFKDKLVPGVLKSSHNTFFYHPLEDDLCSHNVTQLLLHRAALPADEQTLSRMAQFAQPGTAGDGLAVVNWYGLARALSLYNHNGAAGDGGPDGEGAGGDSAVALAGGAAGVGGKADDIRPAWESSAASSWARGEAARPDYEAERASDDESLSEEKVQELAAAARTLLDDSGVQALRALVLPEHKRMLELGHLELPHMEWFTDNILMDNNGIQGSSIGDLRVEPQIMSFELALDEENRLSVVSSEPELKAWLERSDSSTVFNLITRPLLHRMVPEVMSAAAPSSSRHSRELSKDLEKFEALAARVRRGSRATPADIDHFVRRYELTAAQVKELFHLPDPADGLKQLITGRESRALSRVLACSSAVLTLPSALSEIVITRKKIRPNKACDNAMLVSAAAATDEASAAEEATGEDGSAAVAMRVIPAWLLKPEAAPGSLCMVLDSTINEARIDKSLVLHMPKFLLSHLSDDCQLIYTGIKSDEYCCINSSSVQAIMGDDRINLPMVEAVSCKGPALETLPPLDRPGPAVMVWLAQNRDIDLSAWIKGWSQLYAVELLRIMNLFSLSPDADQRRAWGKAANAASTWHELVALMELSDGSYQPESAAGTALTHFESRAAALTSKGAAMEPVTVSLESIGRWLRQPLFNLLFRLQKPAEVLSNTAKENIQNLNLVLSQDAVEHSMRSPARLELPGGSGRGSAGMVDPDNSLSSVYSGMSQDVITANVLEQIMLRLRISEFEELRRYYLMISDAAGEELDPELISPELARAILAWSGIFNTFRSEHSDINANGLETLGRRITILMQKLNHYFEPYHAGERFAIVDTNYLIDNSERLQELTRSYTVVVPEIVLRELDRKKFTSRAGSSTADARLGHAVRRAVSALESLDLKRSAVAAPQSCRDFLNSFGKNRTSGDDLVLATAFHYKLNDMVLFTADRILRSRAEMLGITTSDSVSG